MTQGENTRSIRRLRHDVDAIYEILEINGQRLDGLAAGQRDMIVRLDRLEGVTDGHTATLAEHGAKLDQILDLLHRRLPDLPQR